MIVLIALILFKSGIIKVSSTKRFRFLEMEIGLKEIEPSHKGSLTGTGGFWFYVMFLCLQTQQTQRYIKCLRKKQWSKVMLKTKTDQFAKLVEPRHIGIGQLGKSFEVGGICQTSSLPISPQKKRLFIPIIGSLAVRILGRNGGPANKN